MSDKCGPAGDSKLARFISWLVPDKIWGVDLAGCCEEHDQDYETSDRRKAADIRFRTCIKCRFRAAAIRTGKRYKKWIASLVAGWYYVGVRLGGWLCHDKDD